MERPRAMQELEKVIQRGHKVLWSRSNNEPQYDHLTQKDLEELTKAVQEAEKWIESARQAFRDQKPYSPPKIKVADIQNQIKTTESRINPIINKKKPAPEPAKQPTPNDQAADQQQQPNAAGNNQGGNNGGKPGESPESMDVE